MPDEWVYIEVEKILRSTSKAFLFQLPDGREEWIPGGKK
jgi:hypothetical protein